MKDRMNKNIFHIGAYLLQENARTEAHVRDIAECGLDLIVCLSAKKNESGTGYDTGIFDLFSRYGLRVNAPVTAYHAFPDVDGEVRFAPCAMIDLGIKKGDLILVKKTSEASDGQVIAALTEEGNTLKRIRYENGVPVLYSDDPREKKNVTVNIAEPDYHGTMMLCGKCKTILAVIEKPKVAEGFVALPIINEAV